MLPCSIIYHYPSSSGHLDRFNGSEQRRNLPCQNAAPLPLQFMEAVGWENTLQMWRWGWGGFHFVGVFLLHYQYPSGPGHLDGFNGSEQRRSLPCQKAMPLPFQQIEAAGWENTHQRWRWGWRLHTFCRCFPAPLPIPIEPWTSGWV